MYLCTGFRQNILAIKKVDTKWVHIVCGWLTGGIMSYKKNIGTMTVVNLQVGKCHTVKRTHQHNDCGWLTIRKMYWYYFD